MSEMEKYNRRDQLTTWAVSVCIRCIPIVGRMEEMIEMRKCDRFTDGQIRVPDKRWNRSVLPVSSCVVKGLSLQAVIIVIISQYSRDDVTSFMANGRLAIERLT